MSNATKMACGGFALCLAIVALGLVAQNVKYKPYGVPDHLRPEYEAMLARTAARKQALNSSQPTDLPKARFESTVHDFGLIEPHSTASHSFVVHNDGDAALSLEVTDTSCKCTVGDLARDTLLPGESTTVTVSWNTGYKSDTYEQVALIATNDPRHQTIKLKVLGEVKSELAIPESAAMNTADPGEPSSVKIAMYSQLWPSFSILEATSELPGFQWEAEPLELDDPSLIDTEPRSAMLFIPSTVGNPRGEFTSEVELVILPEGAIEPITRTIELSGKVRDPIMFISQDIHFSQGLDVGTLVTGTKHEFKLIARARGEHAEERDLEVLDVVPAELQVSLEKLRNGKDYRLTLTVPADCQPVSFQVGDTNGYISVGDPTDENYKNWFPITGAVVELDE